MNGFAAHVNMVIFDLWKTLIPLSAATKRLAFEETATALGMAPDELRPAWEVTRVARETVDLRRYLFGLGAILGRGWSDDTVSLAMEARRRRHRVGFLHPMDDALPCLREIRELGIKIAVISNGSSDVVHMLDESPIAEYVDVSVISGVFGMMKPAAAIYREAAAALSTPLERSLYVGDGLDHELEGAEAVGCRAVLVERGSPNSWTGTVIPSLGGLAALLTNEKHEGASI